jgi:putative hydrolase of the HAD superfamily
MIKGIFFDVGGVLLTHDIETFYMVLSKKLGVDYERFMAIHHKYKQKLLLGKMTAREFCAKAEKEFKMDMMYSKLWKTTYLKVTPPNTGVLKIIDRLKGKYVLGIISNSMEDCDAINTERGVYKGFKPVILSSRRGVAKPDIGIFELALKEARLKPEECVFIDDREILLETPKKMGFHTILYKTAKQLEKELEKSGVAVKLLKSITFKKRL